MIGVCNAMIGVKSSTSFARPITQGKGIKRDTDESDHDDNVSIIASSLSTVYLKCDTEEELDSSIEAEELSFLAPLPSITSSERLLSKALVGARNVCTSVAKIPSTLTPRRGKRLLPRRLIKLVRRSIGVLILSIIVHLLLMALAVYQYTKLDPSSLVIEKLHLTKLDSDSAIFDLAMRLPSVWASRFLTLNVVNLKAGLYHDGFNPVLEVALPDVVLGGGGFTDLRIEQVKLESKSEKSLAIILYEAAVEKTESSLMKAAITAEMRVSLLGIPLKLPMNKSHQFDCENLFSNSEMPSDVKPKLSRISVCSSDKAGTDVEVSIRLPSVMIKPFLLIDVPELGGLVWIKDEAGQLFLGNVRTSHHMISLTVFR